MQDLHSFLNESILDPIKQKLDDELWKNGKLKSSVKSFILSKITNWLKAYTSKPIKEIFIFHFSKVHHLIFE